MSDDLERRLGALLEDLPGPDPAATRAARARVVPPQPVWRRALAPAVAIAAAALVVGVLLVAAPGGDPAPAPPVATTPVVPAGWRTVEDPARGVSVEVPPGWRVADRVLATGVSDPHEILSMGTGALTVSDPSCAHVPGRAATAAGPDGAFISLQEQVSGSRPERDFPPRDRAGLDAVATGGESRFVCLTATDVRVRWIPFSDGERSFYLLVAVGERAPATIRDETQRVVDSLRIAPGRTVGPGPWLRLPEGWFASEGFVQMGAAPATLLRVASSPVVPVPAADGSPGLGDDDVLVDVLLRRPLPGRQEPAETGVLPLRFTRDDVPREAYTGQTARVVIRRQVRVGEWVLQVRVALGPGITTAPPDGLQDLPSDLDARLERANAVLATLVLPPG
jgi:hypothetical protein